MEDIFHAIAQGSWSPEMEIAKGVLYSRTVAIVPAACSQPEPLREKC
jgi:hypothetical protein